MITIANSWENEQFHRKYWKKGTKDAHCGATTTLKVNAVVLWEERASFAAQVIDANDRRKESGKSSLDGLKMEGGHEYGFTLPLTEEWKERVQSIGLGYLLEYMGARVLRFREFGTISSKSHEYIRQMTFKDAIPCWTSEELEVLVAIIDELQYDSWRDESKCKGELIRRSPTPIQRLPALEQRRSSDAKVHVDERKTTLITRDEVAMSARWSPHMICVHVLEIAGLAVLAYMFYEGYQGRLQF